MSAKHSGNRMARSKTRRSPPAQRSSPPPSGPPAIHPDLQINCMRALVTVYDLKGFRRAAEALYVTQPAISQQIKQLSRFIKAPVFTSTRQELELSPEGLELLGYARRLVALNDETAEHFCPPAPGEGRVTVGVSDQLAEALPAILSRVADAMPNAQICALTGETEILQSGIETGQLDLALLLNPVGTPHGASHELGSLSMDWFGQPAIEQDGQVPVVLFAEPWALRGIVIELLENSDATWHIAYEGAELEGIRAAVRAGLGVACLVANSDELWGLPRTVDLSLPEPPAAVPVSLAVPEGSSRELATVAKAALTEALADYPFAA
jgi:DNA-binding transcriptional LysR family regulator